MAYLLPRRGISGWKDRECPYYRPIGDEKCSPSSPSCNSGTNEDGRVYCEVLVDLEGDETVRR